MKNKLLPLMMLGTFCFSTLALAQVNGNNTNTGNQSGNVGTAPATIMSTDDLGDFAMWLLNRTHTLNFDARVADMLKNGVKSKQFVTGFSVEGALVYEYELNGDELADWNDIGRNAGMQLLPYSIQIMEDGTKKVSFSAFALRNMNAHQNSGHKFDDADIFKVMDRLDVVNFTWDERSTFNNIRTFDFTAVNTNLKIGLVKSKDDKNYLALRTGGNFGGVITKVDGINAFGYNMPRRADMGWKGEYHGGLELNFQGAKSNSRLNVQSNFINGVNEMRLVNPKVAGENEKNSLQYQSDLSNFNTNNTKWLMDKLAYEAANTNGVPISDTSYAVLSGVAKPIKPIEQGTLSENRDFLRTYAYLNNSIDFSVPLKGSKGRPMRLGVGFNVNVVFYDRADQHDSDSAYGLPTTIDFKNNFNKAFTGRLYLNF